MMLTEDNLTEMVKQAMQERAPKMFAELEAEGSLDKIARMRAQAAMEVHDELVHNARDKAATSNKPPLERVQEQMRLNKQARKIAIAQATEFLEETSDET